MLLMKTEVIPCFTDHVQADDVTNQISTTKEIIRGKRCNYTIAV